MDTKTIFATLLLVLSAMGAYAGSYGPQHDKVQSLFRSDAEPSAKDATWTQKGIFKVGVIDNGRDRSGYAGYICEVLYDHGFKGKQVWVQVIDIVKLTRQKKWVKLGQAHCQ